MNYYQHHIGDFIRDTARLTDAQSMAYLRMIWMYYETEEPLDCDPEALAFKIGANASDVHQILKHFFFEFEGKWHHSRCNKEILSFRKKSDKAKASANARWENAKAMRTHSDGNANEHVIDANQEPGTNNQKPEEQNLFGTADADAGDKPEELPAAFLEVWDAYPKRAGGNSRKDALKAWRARLRSGVTAEVMLEGVKRYAAFCEATQKVGTEYVKQAASFFGTGEHYLAEWAVPAKARNGRPSINAMMTAGGHDEFFGDLRP